MNSKPVKIPLLEAAKWVLVALLLVFIIFLLSANRVSQASFESVRDAVVASADLSPMAEADSQMLGRLYGLSAGDYEGVCLYAPTTNMGAEELLVIKLKDRSQQEAVKAAIEARIQTQMDSFEGYGVTQYEMLENAVIEVQGNFVLFVAAADPAPVRKAFLGAL